jgi:small subunit ribosomal protein S20
LNRTVIRPGNRRGGTELGTDPEPIRQDDKIDKEFNGMANTSSAKKAARQMITRTARNKTRRTRLKSSVRGVEEAIASGDKAAATAALKSVEPILARTAQKGIIHKKTASRKVSRLAARVKSMA